MSRVYTLEAYAFLVNQPEFYTVLDHGNQMTKMCLLSQSHKKWLSQKMALPRS